MLVIPAIDLRDGRCVRLRQGRYEDETVYFDDPVRMAKLWRVMNAKVIHLVDLDAARTTADEISHNRDVIARIAAALDVPVQVGGGIRTLDHIQAMLDLGVYRVVLGTAAVRNPDLVSEAVGRFGASRIVVGIDASKGEVMTEGWEAGSGVDAVDLALDMEARGVRRFVYTDIARDGTLEGPNIEAYREMGGRLTRAHLTASGGVGDYTDLLALQAAEPFRVDSVIVGRALYENRFPCQQFWCWHKKDEVDLDRFSTARLALRG
ncbi:1-(5-phosphoribosyl)-5-[(5-phosphoribosylamino)methylideneamino]imidazole-4-carboxamide isomerase [Rubrivirga sp. SAORIC476]|uniref:1-(5-phosphoribosyl)-5-[(5- phosphoribosylamino)methylideneamino]imidazole-4- carboxamide isomerase n=1 Tax=Rubrivirga sp. SAORIC476 TaxID=1961794 RepID=UPI000BA9A9E5|nr:1-(5-phosphoribosyl)-5-[(5-phosphoribosylamino)methylideneamino]imidazole-4-carboxamide isomerase [Rubrivirga sp. SAORIC476]MBC13523.1 1-(5-phosphoribosyl)-5-[(5-phosphoribosylamino)methylideneamino]imidazole-4-carboxamide isomerase [Rhodothermaceae bacterium]PAP80226.1 1-(5-phosphoribosyl)-5-[(5-phosphoribosylamino)methylideneamino]imidazole-4-carboxamide isomerase [Rubrivirga sp. SAORIC476]